ncbi:MAG TPA: alanine--glyoxylate aminotransferase family protein [Candidatus Glassbacteria bacterium]|nr:alanine--glyoxylate aminotransferase family protein [Candidatus Glassbacteria bacterium]
MTSHRKLFIPGPTEVTPDVLAELSRPMIGHRFPEMSELVGAIIPKVQEMLYTKNMIFLSTSSGTGLMEAAVRNCVKNSCLSFVNGAFSQRFQKIAQVNGKTAIPFEIPWGHGFNADIVDKALSQNKGVDAITLVHNETSTAAMSDIYGICELMKAKYPEVSILVDMVSSMAGVKLEIDRLGVDVALASGQKALALPPGIAVAAISPRALDKARTVENRGFYFDFINVEKNYAKNQSHITPTIPHFYAMKKQMETIIAEGLENRWNRHKKMAGLVRAWAEKNYRIFTQEGFRSETLTCIDNTRGTDISALNKELAKRSLVISNGYGDLKDKTFRIAHMGELTIQDIKEVLAAIDEILGL